MKPSAWNRNSVKRMAVATALILGAGTAAFQGMTHVVAGAEYNKTDIVPTSYANVVSSFSQTMQDRPPEGYKPANYTVGDIDLEYYKNQTPTSKDMAREKAAEIGAQALWSVFGVHLDGQVIEMGYHAVRESLPRSEWYGEVQISDELLYFFRVDSVTGELFSVGQSRTLQEDVSVGFDTSLDKNPQEFIDLAKETAEKLNIVHSPVASVEYQGQGYTQNDPDVMLEIKGENGEVAQVVFSRYDKALKSISYHASYQYTLKEMERLEQELQQLSIPAFEEIKEPTLLVYPPNGQDQE